ncbi:tail protein X [Stenotrophomonas maltophilia]|uniref:tail protein X n=1 Tax=Stenotrophomonas maltophilia TaxID=40324 RepID=UPI002B1CF3CF|nr:tail protein X [Stenotrophomonas maltophilia]
MPKRYKTRDGDVIDRVAFAHYGEQSPDVLRAVFEANPGLAARGPVLPAGVTVILPEIPKPATTRKGVELWD